MPACRYLWRFLARLLLRHLMLGESSQMVRRVTSTSQVTLRTSITEEDLRSYSLALLLDLILSPCSTKSVRLRATSTTARLSSTHSRSHHGVDRAYDGGIG